MESSESSEKSSSIAGFFCRQDDDCAADSKAWLGVLVMFERGEGEQRSTISESSESSSLSSSLSFEEGSTMTVFLLRRELGAVRVSSTTGVVLVRSTTSSEESEESAEGSCES